MLNLQNKQLKEIKWVCVMEWDLFFNWKLLASDRLHQEMK